MKKKSFLMNLLSIALACIILVFSDTPILGNDTQSATKLEYGKETYQVLDMNNQNIQYEFTVQESSVLGKNISSLYVAIENSSENLLNYIHVTLTHISDSRIISGTILENQYLFSELIGGDYNLQLSLKPEQESPVPLKIYLEHMHIDIIRKLTVSPKVISGKTKIISGKIEGVSKEANLNSTAILKYLGTDNVISKGNVKVDGTFVLKTNLAKIKDQKQLAVFVDTNTNEFGSKLPQRIFSFIGIPQKVKIRNRKITSKTSVIKGNADPDVKIMLYINQRKAMTVRTDKKGQFSLNLKKRLRKVKKSTQLKFIAVRSRQGVTINSQPSLQKLRG